MDYVWLVGYYDEEPGCWTLRYVGLGPAEAALQARLIARQEDECCWVVPVPLGCPVEDVSSYNIHYYCDCDIRPAETEQRLRRIAAANWVGRGFLDQFVNIEVG